MDKAPILIEDYHSEALLRPSEIVNILLYKHRFKLDDIPRRCVLSFKYTGLEKIIKVKYKGIKIADILGITPLYIFETGGYRYCYSNLCTGGPCSALILEILYEMGVEDAVYIGSVGVLKPNIKPYDIIISLKAVRDEGTSYHYLPPSMYVEANEELYIKLKKRLNNRGFRFHEGNIWTTDTIFRETSLKRKIFLNSGVIAVDMEAASLFAVAKYRNKRIIGIYFPLDLLREDKWISYMENYHGLKYLKFINNLLKIATEVLK